MDELLICRHCGSRHVERHGIKPGDFPWAMCRDCGFCWDLKPPDQQRKEAPHDDKTGRESEH